MKKNIPHTFTLSEALKTIGGLRQRGAKIVLTNGCFDLLHTGHLNTLRYARSFGDFLIVAVNNDASVSRLKGHTRPIMTELVRAEILSELRHVDCVILFGEDSALEIVKTIRPDIYVKGGDYDLHNTPEGKVVLDYGGRMITAPLLPGISTTLILERIHKHIKSRDKEKIL